jgi:hypothetical protein
MSNIKMGINNAIRSYFCAEEATELNQIVIAFTLGLLLGPFPTNLLFKLVLIIIYEIILFYYTSGLAPYWRCLNRIAVNSAGLYGYFLGRWLITGSTGLEYLVRT